MPPEFTPATIAKLDHAAALCDRRGTRLTELRRQVLGLILDADAPTGAYDLLEMLRGHRGASAPPTVYRALEFLLEQGFVHRIERLSAFVGCIETGDHGHHHAAQFLICRTCGHATEIDDHALAHALAHAAEAVGFKVSGATIEAEGMCAKCRQDEGAAVAPQAPRKNLPGTSPPGPRHIKA
jgi:Fur family transcriptional regulator, zinc uptake regulator